MGGCVGQESQDGSHSFMIAAPILYVSCTNIKKGQGFRCAAAEFDFLNHICRCQQMMLEGERL